MIAAVIDERPQPGDFTTEFQWVPGPMAIDFGSVRLVQNRPNIGEMFGSIDLTLIRWQCPLHGEHLGLIFAHLCTELFIYTFMCYVYVEISKYMSFVSIYLYLFIYHTHHTYVLSKIMVLTVGAFPKVPAPGTTSPSLCPHYPWHSTAKVCPDQPAFQTAEGKASWLETAETIIFHGEKPMDNFI